MDINGYALVTGAGTSLPPFPSLTSPSRSSQLLSYRHLDRLRHRQRLCPRVCRRRGRRRRVRRHGQGCRRIRGAREPDLGDEPAVQDFSPAGRCDQGGRGG